MYMKKSSNSLIATLCLAAAALAVTAASAEEKVVLTSPFTDAIAKVRDSVVGVNNYQIVNNYSNGYDNYGSYFPWSYFGFGNGGYGNGYGYGYNQPESSEEVKYGSGSGVVIASEYVLTNYHVVENAHSLKISVGEDEENLYDATVVASDSDKDVAVLKVPGLPLAPVELGDSDSLVIGDWVVCIGNPIGFTGTPTAGIVSGLNREIPGDGSTTDKYGRSTQVVNSMIQTDAAINSGNSGGGMFNTAGELVGIPTLKYTGSRYSSTATIESIGMCIPINDAKSVIETALQSDPDAPVIDNGEQAEDPQAGDNQNNGGLSGKPRMGVTTTTLNGASISGGVLPNGAYVISVDAGSPAERAGMQMGDIIVEANDTVITTTTDLKNLLYELKEGDEVNIKVFRTGVDLTTADTLPTDGEYVDLTVVLAIVDAIAQ